MILLSKRRNIVGSFPISTAKPRRLALRVTAARPQLNAARCFSWRSFYLPRFVDQRPSRYSGTGRFITAATSPSAIWPRCTTRASAASLKSPSTISEAALLSRRNAQIETMRAAARRESGLIKLRNTQHEQISSALPPTTDVGLARPIFASPILLVVTNPARRNSPRRMPKP